MLDVYTTPLAEQDEEFWLNAILIRLARAAGLIEEGKVEYDIDPDEALTAAEDALFRLKGLDK